ncbi:MAG TPA: threonine/serine dehydratase [Candidatus Handelsmanbacteria bacterium]|nr:threonine/serine dehydratase [Candidatus Handelsmanbacteria bacterium]
MILLDDISAAQKRLDGVAVKTGLLPWSDSAEGEQWYFKPEGLQPIGAFKLRGGYNKIATLSDAERSRGVIAFSSGNHAQGVAYAARLLGIRAVIVMPARAPEIKRLKTEAMGAEVVLLSEGGEEQWRAHAEALAAQQGLVMVPPFNDETVIAGNGTCGLEILDEMPDVDMVLVPIGGGGLISGIGAALKMSRPEIKIIGVEPELANDAQLSLQQGKLVALPIEQTKQTAADGMRATQLGDITYRYIREYVDDIITVNEQEIRAAVRTLALDSRLVAEPSGAVPVAALLNRREELPAAKKIVAVISGGNIDPQLLADILQGA